MPSAGNPVDLNVPKGRLPRYVHAHIHGNFRNCDSHDDCDIDGEVGKQMGAGVKPALNRMVESNVGIGAGDIVLQVQAGNNRTTPVKIL